MESKNNSSEEESNDSINKEKSSIEEKKKYPKEKKLTRIGNKLYYKDTKNRNTIVRLTQRRVEPSKIKKMLDTSRSLLSKWVNYDKRPLKKMGRPPEFHDEYKKFLY